MAREHAIPLIVLVYLTACVSFGLASKCGKYADKLLIISMDGFRWDYLNNVDSPNFDRFAKLGVKAPYLNNTFITKTFPSHFTMATGLYEESHGIIGNRMYDPVFNAIFNMGTTDSRWWNGGEPIWVTARKQNLRSATYYWPGSEVEIRDTRPNFWYKYNESVPFKTRVDKVVEWFLHENINLATLYLHEPDLTGHRKGPDSPEVFEKVKEMDTLLGYIVAKLEENHLWNTVNVIVTSDHGMTEVDPHHKVIDIPHLIDTAIVKGFYDHGPIMHFLPEDGKGDELYRSLHSVHPNMTVYRKEDLPDFWHYKHNRRIMPIVAVADEGWQITTNKSVLEYFNENGTHGYDNRLMNMRPIFFAHGPNFKKDHVTEPFLTVDLYPLMCELLGLFPAPNNGSLDITKSFITQTDHHGETCTGSIATSALWSSFFIVILGLFLVNDL